MSDHGEHSLPEIIKDVILSVDGIPLPAVVKKSLWKSLARLITGAVDVPVAWLDSKVKLIQANTAARTTLIKKAGDAAAEKFALDPALVNRSIDYFGRTMLKEQSNRETVVQQTVLEIKNDPPKEDAAGEISEDWLTAFGKIAEQKSDKDIQLFLSKILAGEIRRPGTFSLRTINLIAMLDQSTAQLFQQFCDLSLSIPYLLGDFSFVITEPIGSPGENALAPFSLSYNNLSKLHDAGLIQGDFSAHRKFHPIVFAAGFSLGGSTFGGTPVHPDEYREKFESVEIKTLNFTDAGLEIRGVLHLGGNVEYEDQILAWLTKEFELHPSRSSSE